MNYSVDKKIMDRAIAMRDELKPTFDKEFEAVYFTEADIGKMIPTLPNYNQKTAYTYDSNVSFEHFMSMMKGFSNGNPFYVTKEFVVIPEFRGDVEGWIYMVSGYFGLTGSTKEL